MAGYKDENSYLENHSVSTFTEPQINGLFVFGFLLSIYLLLAFIANNYVYDHEFYARSYSNLIPVEGFETLIKIQNEYWWVSYISAPIILTVKVYFAAACIGIGVVIRSGEVKFKKILLCVLIAEAVFVLANILYVLNLSLHQDEITVQTAVSYYPLSAINYLNYESIAPWLQYPLQTLNLFEPSFVLLVSWLFCKSMKEKYIKSLSLVALSYGTGLIIWLVFVVFITLQVT